MPVAADGPAAGGRAGQVIERRPDCPIGVMMVAFPGVESRGRVMGRSAEGKRGTRGGHDRCRRRGGGAGERRRLG